MIRNKAAFSFCLLVLSSLPVPSVADPAPPSLTYSVTWAGNTFGGETVTTAGGWSRHKHVQLAIDDMAVDADGTVFTDSGWDEGGNEAGIYKNDDMIGNCQDLSHGWGRSGGRAVAFGSEYVYVAMHQNGDDGANTNLNKNGLRDYPDRGNDWICVRRFDKTGKSAPFPSGYGSFDDMMIVSKVSTAPGPKTADIDGLAVNGGKLYVSDTLGNHIAVYDTSQLSGTPTASWNIDAPGKMAFDSAGRMWVLHGAIKPTVACFSASGVLLDRQIIFADTVTPSAIAWDAAAGRLLVADKGIDQNIKLYNPARLSGSPTAPASTFGVAGGIHSRTNGIILPMCFFDPSGVGADANGNIYIANGGAGLSLESYKPNGDRCWATPLQCLEFVNCADADPQSDTNIYSSNMHYVFDYSKPSGRGWKLSGITLDRFKYPDDARLRSLHGGVWVRSINGRKYLFLTEQMGNKIGVQRLIQSPFQDIAAPYALISPRSNTSPESILRDLTGDGHLVLGVNGTPAANTETAYNAGWGEWVDSAGDIWQCGHGHIRHFKMHLDQTGRPVWDYAKGDVELLNPPALPDGATWQHGNNADDDDMDRICYQPVTDTMYVSGFTSQYPDDTAHAWGNAGRVLYRFDHWSTSRAIHAGYPILLPWNATKSQTIKSISIEGRYVFAVQAMDPEPVSIFDVDTGTLVGTMTPDDTVGKSSGWVDENIGICAHERGNGEYIVFVEEDLNEKALIYRWTPPARNRPK